MCSVPSGGVNDVEDLLTARVHLEQLEVRENVQAQLDSIRVPLTLVSGDHVKLGEILDDTGRTSKLDSVSGCR